MDSHYSPPHHWPPQGLQGIGGGVVIDQKPAEKTTATKICRPQKSLNCRRCNSSNTKFCYYNNYSLSQPRYFCKSCRRYWTEGGTLRNVPVGGGSRKTKLISTRPNNYSSNSSSSSPKKLPPPAVLIPNYENPSSTNSPNLGFFVSAQNPNFSFLQQQPDNNNPSLMMMMKTTMSLMGFSIDQNGYNSTTTRLMPDHHQDRNFNANSSPFDQEIVKGASGGIISSSDYINVLGEEGRSGELDQGDDDQVMMNNGGGGGGGSYNYWMNGMLGGGSGTTPSF